MSLISTCFLEKYYFKRPWYRSDILAVILSLLGTLSLFFKSTLMASQKEFDIKSKTEKTSRPIIGVGVLVVAYFFRSILLIIEEKISKLNISVYYILGLQGVYGTLLSLTAILIQ